MSDDVAIIMSGAAARGAFQAGALSRVIPALRADGYRPSIFLGTSVGAINAAMWGSLAHLETDEAVDSMLRTWRSMDSKGIYRHPVRTMLTGDGPRLLLSMVGIGHGASALLDTSPLATRSARLVDMEQLARNVQDGHIDGIGVTATRMPRASGGRDGRDRPRTMIFMHGPGLPLHKVRDPARAVDMCEGPLVAEHVLASAAIPMGFPPVRIEPSTSRSFAASAV